MRFLNPKDLAASLANKTLTNREGDAKGSHYVRITTL